MKIRTGFVSNSSSGSFIFPRGMSEERVSEIIKKIEDFLTDIGGEPISSGLCEPQCNERGHVVVDTISDNTCPYEFQIILENIVGAMYDHHG